MSSGTTYSRLRRCWEGPVIFLPTRRLFSKSSSCSRVKRVPCSFQQCFSRLRRYLNARRSQKGQGTADLSAGAIGPPCMTFKYSSRIFTSSLKLHRTSLFAHASRRSSSSTSPSPSPSASSSAASFPSAASVATTATSVGVASSFASVSMEVAVATGSVAVAVAAASAPSPVTFSGKSVVSSFVTPVFVTPVSSPTRALGS
mmetsp:Transcript_7304/g.27483  ORF Transcript_7304/g.27483 Transcript_7304/m.27483 type:complete len:201 (-) Transcript_7304:808-1410(-)